MPAVAAFFVAGLGAQIAAVFGIVAHTAVYLAIGSTAIALTVAGARRVGKLKDTSEIDRPSGISVAVESTEIPRIIAYGEVQVGGVITYKNTAGTEHRDLYFEIVHVDSAQDGIDSFIGWYIDDKFVPIADVDNIVGGGDGSVDGNTGGHGLDDVAAGPVLYLRGHLGTAAQAVDSMLNSAFVDAGTNHRHRRCAKTVVRCVLVPGSESKWNGRAPQSITAVMRAMKVYDPRADGTFPAGSGAQRLATPSTWAWSDNPALIWANYRTLAAPLGPGWDTDRIDWQSVFDAANACDALVAIPTATTEKRFRCDLVVDASMEPREVIAKILATMAGKERHFNGLWHVYAGTFPATDFALTDDDPIGEVQYRKQPQIEDRYNQVKGSFIDRARLWKRVQFISVNNTTLRTNRDNGRVLAKELELDGVTREYQAQRLAMRALNQADDTGLLVFPTGYNGLNIRVGDTGTVSNSKRGWVNKTFRCVAPTFVEFQGAELLLKEDASGNYSDPAEGEYSVRTAAGDIVFGTVMPWYLASVVADRWTPNFVNVTPTGSTFTKTGGSGSAFDASVYSSEGYARCVAQWKVSQTDNDVAVGFDTAPAAAHTVAAIEFALYAGADGNLYYSESGSSAWLGVSYTDTDLLTLVYDGVFMRYYKNAQLLRAVAVPTPNALYFLDSSFFEIGAAIYEVRFAPTSSVGTNQIDPEAVDTPQLADDAVETPKVALEAVREVASTTEAGPITASANNAVDEQVAATTSLTVSETTDVYEVSCSGISTVTSTGSPASPEANVNLRYRVNGGAWTSMAPLFQRSIGDAGPFAFVGTVTGLTAAATVDFATQVIAAESGGGGTVNHALTQVSLVAAKAKRATT